MAETKIHENKIEREYVIPLRKEWTKVPNYKRTAKSIKAIKEFVAKHMKVPGRDLDNVKIDSYFNNEVWYRGAGTPPARVKVKVVKVGDIATVTFAQDPERVKFARERHVRKHSKADKKVVSEKKEETKTEEAKNIESEKEQATAVANEKLAEQKVKEQHHVAKDNMAHKKAPIQRRRTIASN